MGVKVTLKYDGKMFDGINKNDAVRFLKKYMTGLTQGTTANPLFAHWAEGQVNWPQPDPEYAEWKKKTHGSDDQFVLTGDAKKAITGKPGAIKKIRVSYRKKGQYFLMTAGIQKMKDGRNVYQIAQKGRFGGIAFTSGGEKKQVTAGEWLRENNRQNIEWVKAVKNGQDMGKTKKGNWKAARISEKFGIDKGSSSRVSSGERLITANLPGDQRFLKDSDLAPLVEKIIQESGYDLS